MKVLFDQGTPLPLRWHLPEHLVDTAAEKGRSDVDNGALIDRAEQEGYEVLVTTDQNMRHQQNLRNRRLTLVVLPSTAWPRIQLRTEEIRAAIDGIQPGESRDVPI